MTGSRFAELGLDPWAWFPAPLINQVVLVGTMDGEGVPSLAPKTSAAFASTALPAVGFACSRTHHTLANLGGTGEFVVNVPDRSQAEAVWRAGGLESRERLDAAGWHVRPGEVVGAACWDEAAAQLECTHLATVDVCGDEVLVLGRVVAARVRQDLIPRDGDVAGAYRRFDPLFYLQPRWFAGLAEAVRVPRPG